MRLRFKFKVEVEVEVRVLRVTSSSNLKGEIHDGGVDVSRHFWS